MSRGECQVFCEDFVKIRYSHINRENVLPLGKDMVQIHPIPLRFIDTIFSIRYIVGDISKKELTAMPRINDGRKKFIAFILIIILSFLCVCSHSDHSCSVHTGHTANTEGTQLSENHAESSLESGDIKTPDANRIIEANIVYNVRTGEQLTRRRQNAKGFEELLDCAGVLFLENNQTGNLIINPPLSSTDDLMKYMQIDFLQPQSPSSAVRTDLWFYLHHSSCSYRRA